MLKTWLTISKEEMFRKWRDHLTSAVKIAKERLKIKTPLLWMTAKTPERRIKVTKRSMRMDRLRRP
jgi:hypothetical protein